MSYLTTFVLAVAAALGFSFICSVAEATLLSLPRTEVEVLAKKGSRSGRILKRFHQSIDRPIAAILVLNTVANTLGATVAGASYEHTFSERTLWLFSIAFTLAVLLFGEIIPKTIGVSFASRLAGPVAYVVAAFAWLLAPVLWATSGLTRLLTRGRPTRHAPSSEELRLLAQIGRSEGAVGLRMAQFIEGAASLRELTVHDVMVPRGGVAFLSSSRSLQENLDLIRASGHSRFPFAPTGNLDDVSGVVLAKELLFRARECVDEVEWDTLVTPLVVVPETTTLEQVLRVFQDQRKHLAVVVDEYGGTQGVVTLEDVLEEIVGEIEDETDRVEQLIIKRPDGSLVCRGWVETRKVFRLLGIDGKADVVTLSGFVADLLGRVPTVGEVASWQGYRFRVLKASARRAERIEVTRESPET